MSLRVVFRRPAQDELLEAAAWYEAQREGLGQQFFAEISEAIERAAEHPERYPIANRDVRRTVCRRFPFAVYFRVRGSMLVVIAVFHARRDPAVWQGRS